MLAEIINKVYAYRDISSTESAILAYLAKYADVQGEGLFVGNERIALDTKFALITVKLSMVSLRQKGLIILDGKEGRKNKYKLNLAKLGVDHARLQPRRTNLMPIPRDGQLDASQTALNGHNGHVHFSPSPPRQDPAHTPEQVRKRIEKTRRDLAEGYIEAITGRQMLEQLELELERLERLEEPHGNR